MSDQRISDSDQSKRDIPSFIEAPPPLISNPFMRPRPQKGINLMELFDENSEIEYEDPELVQVYLRLKPCRPNSKLYEVKSDRCLITSVDTATAGHGRRTQHNVSRMYTFSHIFGPESSQKEIFEHVVKDNLRKLPDGHNFTLLTYGASGSGKTYTLMGTVPAPGLVPRSLEYVFRVVDAAQYPVYKPVEGGSDKLELHEQEYELQWVKKLRQVSAPLRDKYRRMSVQLRSDLTASTLDLANRTRYYVWVSFVEIYNEAIYDLLASNDRSKSSARLRIREDSNGQAYVKGATQAFVRSGEEAYDVMVAGKHNLQVAATGVHAQSSRSHCIFTITMLTVTEDGVRTSCVRLCDLAGCERARQTRNTGARMQESRAINSSLHVLERCLHMLRRKQKQKGDSTLVPYRESKLTRLLGAGLSGARGEAVAMVVTLNPAPEFAHETRHVLQLAEVARDIQVNSMMTESTLESVSQDATVDCSLEVMRLRADNERLHFELSQAEAYIRQLKKAIEDKLQDTAKTMTELVKEAKEIERKDFENQLECLQAEMQEMKEEYENEIRELRKANSCRPSSELDTPTRSYKIKIAELRAENAILQETLSQERLAHARVEAEMQHLRACIEERDAKSEADSYTERSVQIVLSDTEGEDEIDDPANESLEPTFRRQTLNKTRLLQQSTCDDSENLTDERDTTVEETDHDATVQGNISESVLEKSTDTVKDVDDKQNDTTKHSISCNDQNETTVVNETNEDSNKKTSETYSDDNRNSDSEIIRHDHCKDSELKCDSKDRGTYFVKDGGDSKDRGTYFVKDGEDLEKPYEETSSNRTKTPVRLLRATYFVTDVKDTSNDDLIEQGCIETNIESKDYSNEIKTPVNVAKEISDKKSGQAIGKSVDTSYKLSHDNDLSLAQFEQLEKDAKCEDSKNTVKTFPDLNFLKEMKYFDDPKLETDKDLIKVKIDKKTYFDNINVNNSTKSVTKIEKSKLINDDKSPSIVKDEVGNNFEPNKALKLMAESFTREPDIISSTHKTNDVSLPKKHLSVDIFDSPNILCKAIEKGNLVEVRSENNISQAVTKKEVAAKADPKIFEKSSHAAEANLKVDSENQCIAKQDLKVKLEVVEPEERQANNKFDLPFVNSEEASNSLNVSILSHTIAKDVTENFRKTTKSPVLDRKRDNEIKSNNETEIKVTEELETFAKPLSVSNNDETSSGHQISNDTTSAFENIFKDISQPRATEFELLVSQEISSGNLNQTNDDKTIESVPNNESSLTYNLRHRDTSATEQKKPTVKRNLRLRRRKKYFDDDKSEESNDESNKLRDVVNLQKEFSDVTMDVPAIKNVVKGIESPEKVAGEEENLPPLNEVQSCPSKSVTRSRRKLFTPRPEPQDESFTGTGDSNERVCVPRPSYHRTRVRRKL